MSVYVGMDVHRKRSQVAVVDAAGAQRRNRNLPQRPGQAGPGPWRAAAGHPGSVRGRLRLGVAGRAARGTGVGAAPGPSQPLQGDRVGPAAGTTRWTRPPWPSCCGRVCRPGPGSRPSRSGICGALLRHRASLVRLSTSLKNRVRAVLADRGIPELSGLWTGPGRAWLADLELPATPRGIVEDCCGLRTPWPPRSPGWNGRSPPWPNPTPRLQALMVLPGVGKLTAMALVAEVGDVGRFPTARKPCAWAGLTPPVRNLPPHAPPRPQHQAGLALGARDPPRKPPRRPSATHVRQRLRPSWPAAAAPTPPPPRSPGGCWPAASTSSTSYRQHQHRRRPLPGALAFPHGPATRPPGLTGQPGSGLTVMRTQRPGPEWVRASQLRTVLRAFSLQRSRHHHNPATYPARPRADPARP
jgi:transposase